MQASPGVNSLAGAVQVALRSGKYYQAGFANFATQALTVDRIYATPFWVPADTPIDRIGLAVSGAGGAGSVIRLGAYRDLPTMGYPGAEVFEAGTIDGTLVASQEIVIAQTLPAGWNWLTAVAQVGTSPSVRSVNGTMQSVPSAGIPGNTNATAVHAAGTPGAPLPAVFDTNQFQTGDPGARIFVRVK